MGFYDEFELALLGIGEFTDESLLIFMSNLGFELEPSAPAGCKYAWTYYKFLSMKGFIKAALHKDHNISDGFHFYYMLFDSSQEGKKRFGPFVVRPSFQNINEAK